MNRIESITTCVRPIKKLFVVDPRDINRFTEIIRLLSHEIAGITNIIIPFSPKIYEENITRFVGQHDPDILLNYSDAESKTLERHFRLDAFSSPPIEEVRRMASTKIALWDNIPNPLLIMADNPLSGEVFSVIAKEGETADLFAALHFGIISPELVDSLKHGIFRGIRIRNIESENIFTLLRDNQQDFNFLTLGLAMERGWSLGEKDDNPSQFFNQKPTIILGSYSDVEGMAYFWNARASYPFNRTLWLPIELVGAVQLDLNEYAHLAITASLEDDPRIQALRAGKQLIDTSLYYFPPRADRWISFEHTATASVIDSNIKVDHPSHKLFSRRGINMNFALDVEGLEEVSAPPSAAVGKLFEGRDANPLGFNRIGSRGFASRIRQFELFRDASIHKNLSLPSDYSVMEAMFSERGFRIERTDIGSTMEQLRVLIGGYSNAAVLASETAWRLINCLAPRRTERIINEIRTAGLSFSGYNEQELAKCLSTVPSLSQQISQTLLQLEGSLQIQKPEKPTFHSLVQKLYDRGLLLRGKSVQCVYCRSKLWFPLESLSKPLRCYCCNSLTVLPVAPSTQAEDAYRLNELIVQAVDQGLVAMLLAMRVLWEQLFFGRRLIPSLLVYRQDDIRPLLEVDIAFTLGKTLGLCEVKSDQPFDLDQANDLIGLAEAMRADLVVFCTIKSSADDTITDLHEYIHQRGTRLPVMILTRNILLGSSDVPQLYGAAYLRDSKKAVVVL